MTLIRQSTNRTDLPRVLEVLQLAFARHAGRIDPPSGAERETVTTLEAKLASETLLVAESEGVIAGCIWCRQQPGRSLSIGRLAVAPAYSGRGIGSALLDASIEHARSLGATAVHLGVRIELTENIAMFQRRGFIVVSADSHPGFDRPTNYHMRLCIEPPRP